MRGRGNRNKSRGRTERNGRGNGSRLAERAEEERSVSSNISEKEEINSLKNASTNVRVEGAGSIFQNGEKNESKSFSIEKGDDIKRDGGEIRKENIRNAQKDDKSAHLL